MTIEAQRIEAAREEGFELFKLDPSMMLIEVWHHAARLHPNDRNVQGAFVDGYQSARLRKDEYEREISERGPDSPSAA